MAGSVRERGEQGNTGNNEMKRFFKRNRWTFTERERGGRRGTIPPVPAPRVHIKTPCGKQVRTGWVVVRGERNDVRSLLYTRTDGCWVKPPWWRMDLARMGRDSYMDLLCHRGKPGIRVSFTSRGASRLEEYLPAVHLQKSDLFDKTTREVQRGACWSRYHGALWYFEMVKQQSREVCELQKATTLLQTDVR